jgi:hypothetical protein
VTIASWVVPSLPVHCALRPGVPRCLLTGLIGRQRFVLAETSDVGCRRHASAEPDFLEPLLDEIDDRFYRFRRDQAVTLGLNEAFIRASSGLPILAPEIALLYTSKDLDAKSWADFHAALPALDAEQRA